MNGTKEQSHIQITDIGNVRLGDRTMSMSSVASSSIAATSIMGDRLSLDSNSSDNDQQQHYSPSKRTEVDRYGFTGGNQYTDPSLVLMSVEKMRIREQKWLSMLNDWERWMSGRFPQVKNRCRKGIPPSLRGRAWQHLSGGKVLYENNKDKYEEYLAMDADANCIDDIEKDLHRQFPFHEMFVKKGGSGQEDLRDVLRAYSVYNKEDGYCQAQAPIAAALLMHMPAEQAFWCMVAMCEHYLQGYFSPGLEAIQVDGYVMQSLLRKVSPVAHKHLEKNQVAPVLYMTEWFMCVFARTLPWTSVLRLWDMFFCEGIKVVFRCALVLLRNTLGTTEKVKALPGLYETMEALRKIDPACMKEDHLMIEIVKLHISERDLEHEHKLQKIKWKKDKDSAPSIAKTAIDGKRVYRYTPTYSQYDTPNKNKTKSKKQISAISVNSQAIIEQAHEAKFRERRGKERRKNKAKFYKENTKTERIKNGDSVSGGKKDEEISPQASDLDVEKVSPHKISPSDELVVTSFTKSSETDTNIVITISSDDKNGSISQEQVNQTDEVTVF